MSVIRIMRPFAGWRVTLCVALFMSAACFQTMAAEISFKRIAPGIYAFIGETEGHTYENEGLNANIGLVDTPAGAVLIDSGASYQGAKQIAEAAAKVTQQAIKWVINTGGQDHRWLGNSYFKAHGAEIIAHQTALPDMKARAFEHAAALAPVLKEKFAGTQAVFPTRLLSGESHVLELGGVVLEIKHRHGGHTPGDSIVWLPKVRKAVESGVDPSTAVKSFNAEPYKALKHVDTWMPQIANQT